MFDEFPEGQAKVFFREPNSVCTQTPFFDLVSAQSCHVEDTCQVSDYVRALLRWNHRIEKFVDRLPRALDLIAARKFEFRPAN